MHLRLCLACGHVGCCDSSPNRHAPLRRYIQREVETRIGRALLSGDIRDGATITLDVDGGELTVTWRNPDESEVEAPEPVGAAA